MNYCVTISDGSYTHTGQGADLLGAIKDLVVEVKGSRCGSDVRLSRILNDIEYLRETVRADDSKARIRKHREESLRGVMKDGVNA